MGIGAPATGSQLKTYTAILSPPVAVAALTTLVLKLHEPWLIILPMSFPGAELPFTTAALLLLPRALVAGAALSASAMRETSSRPQTGSLTDVVAAARVSDSRVGTVRAPSASAYASIHGTRPSKPLLEVLRGEFGPESASETPVDSKPEERGTGYTPSRGIEGVRWRHVWQLAASQVGEAIAWGAALGPGVFGSTSMSGTPVIALGAYAFLMGRARAGAAAAAFGGLAVVILCQQSVLFTSGAAMLPSEPLLKHAIACLGVGAVLLLWHAAVSSGAVTAPRAGGDSPLGPTSEGSEPERGERAFRKAPRLPKNQREKGRQVIATVGSAAAVGSAAIAASAAYWVLGGSGLGDLVAAAGIAWATSMRLKASRRLAAASEGDGGGRGMVARDGEAEAGPSGSSGLEALKKALWDTAGRRERRWAAVVAGAGAVAAGLLLDGAVFNEAVWKGWVGNTYWREIILTEKFKVMSVCSCAYSVAHAAQELLAGVCGIRSHTWRTIWGGTGILACLWWSLPTELLTASIEARVVLGVGVALIVLGSVPWGAIDPRLQPPH